MSDPINYSAFFGCTVEADTPIKLYNTDFIEYFSMADVRSLLRNERAQRRISHPQAIYSATGTLECSVCHILVKSEQDVWNKHLKSTQHAMRQERLRLSTSKPPAQAGSREVSGGSRKRKADEGNDDSRKRSRPVIDLPGGFFDEIIESNNQSVKEPASEQPEAPKSIKIPIEPMPATTTLNPQPIPNPASVPSAPIDEDEWAAFERDVATPPPDPSKPSALTAEATISAAPLTAAELEKQAREQASRQSRERREAEVEGEKEDAARALEEEFDEMEGLEERVARLKKMREELRSRIATDGEDKGGREEERASKRGVEDVESDDEDDDSAYEEDLYGWSGSAR